MREAADMRPKLAGVTPESAVSPLPQVELKPAKAPGAQPRGLSPKTNYSRINSGSPPLPDAGAAAQKSAPPMGAEMLPKLASEGSMGFSKMPTLQDMVKAAMAGAAERITSSEEAVRYSDKTAGEDCKDCGKSDCKCGEKKASVTTDYAEKFASALEYALPFMKEAEITPGQGPGALAVSETTRQDKIPEHHGQANKQPPMRPGEQKAVAGPSNQMANDADRAPGGSEHQKVASPKVLAAIAKLASEEELEKKETEGMNTAQKGLAKAEKAHKEEAKEEKKASESEFISGLTDGLLKFKKEAEDRINPAKISAGSAESTRLQASAAGEAGGAPVGGPPKGPTGLVGSNDSAINYNRAQARSGRKGEMTNYITEPMMSNKNDSTLKDVLTHASAANGNKFASAKDVATKTAAAKALLLKLAEEEEKKAKAAGTTSAAAGN